MITRLGVCNSQDQTTRVYVFGDTNNEIRNSNGDRLQCCGSLTFYQDSEPIMQIHFIHVLEALKDYRDKRFKVNNPEQQNLIKS